MIRHTKIWKNAGRSDSDFALFIKDKTKVKIPTENNNPPYNKPPFWYGNYDR